MMNIARQALFCNASTLFQQPRRALQKTIKHFSGPSLQSKVVSFKQLGEQNSKSAVLNGSFVNNIKTRSPCSFQIRWFRTSLTNNALPPMLVLVASRLSKYAAVLFGRGVRKWWQKLPPEQKAVYIAKLRKNRNFFGGIN